MPWLMQEESYLLPVLLPMALPFGLYPEKRTIRMLERDFKMPVKAAVLLAPAQQAKLHQAHRLEEAETERLLAELVHHRRIESPLRGWHRTSSRPSRADTTTSWLKLLRWT